MQRPLVNYLLLAAFDCPETRVHWSISISFSRTNGIWKVSHLLWSLIRFYCHWVLRLRKIRARRRLVRLLHQAVAAKHSSWSFAANLWLYSNYFHFRSFAARVEPPESLRRGQSGPGHRLLCSAYLHVHGHEHHSRSIHVFYRGTLNHQVHHHCITWLIFFFLH